MTKSRGILGKRKRWTDYEDQVLRKHYPTTLARDLAELLGHTLSSTHQRARRLGVAKDPDWIAATARERVASNPDHGSQACRFSPGHVPANKGKKRPEGWAPGRMRDTQFKAGRLNGRAAQLVAPIGSYRVNADGFLDQKISDTPGPQTLRWRAVHRMVWEAAHGPVPAGHVIAFRPGRKTTDPERITLDALECITLRDNMLRNSLHRYGPQIVKVIQLRGAISRQINRRAKEEGDDHQEPR